MEPELLEMFEELELLEAFEIPESFAAGVQRFGYADMFDLSCSLVECMVGTGLGYLDDYGAIEAAQNLG